jgi:hypothetical protein
MEHPFYETIEERPGMEYEPGDKNYVVALKPELAHYHAELQYDEGGNATVTIWPKDDPENPILNFSLDNGEVFEIGGPLDMDKEGER